MKQNKISSDLPSVLEKIDYTKSLKSISWQPELSGVGGSRVSFFNSLFSNIF